MSKQQLIEAIQHHNRGADSTFLMTFDEPALDHYLQRLTHLQGHRGPGAVWVRRAETPAIVTRGRQFA